MGWGVGICLRTMVGHRLNKGSVFELPAYRDGRDLGACVALPSIYGSRALRRSRAVVVVAYLAGFHVRDVYKNYIARNRVARLCCDLRRSQL